LFIKWIVFLKKNKNKNKIQLLKWNIKSFDKYIDNNKTIFYIKDYLFIIYQYYLFEMNE